MVSFAASPKTPLLTLCQRQAGETLQTFHGWPEKNRVSGRGSSTPDLAKLKFIPDEGEPKLLISYAKYVGVVNIFIRTVFVAVLSEHTSIAQVSLSLNHCEVARTTSGPQPKSGIVSTYPSRSAFHTSFQSLAQTTS